MRRGDRDYCVQRDIKRRLKKIENPVKSDGCGYALEVTADSEEPVKILERGKIKIRGVDTR